MAGSVHPVLESVLQAALDATGATQGWLLATDGDALVVRAIAGTETELLGTRVAADVGFAGYVASSGQPLAMSPRADDPRGSAGVAALVGSSPASVLAVPCLTEDGLHGVLELVTKYGGGPFSFDDVEIATLLGGIAGAALAAGEPERTVPTPGELAGDLAELAAASPARYAALASLLTTVLRDE